MMFLDSSSTVKLDASSCLSIILHRGAIRVSKYNLQLLMSVKVHLPPCKKCIILPQYQ